MATALKAITIATAIIFTSPMLTPVAVTIRLANAMSPDANPVVVAIFRTNPRVAEHADPTILTLTRSSHSAASTVATADMSVPATHENGGVTHICSEQTGGSGGQIREFVPWQLVLVGMRHLYSTLDTPGCIPLVLPCSSAEKCLGSCCSRLRIELNPFKIQVLGRLSAGTRE